ncbi:MAG: integrase family protein [Aliarcobacter sp.]|jgi:integrase|nr:integrase family protein [Aliarcobacter sp.]
MTLEKTKYDGLYFRLDKYGKKVYVARIYKDGKDTTKTLGKEPQLNLKIANKIRLDMIEELSKGYLLKNLNKNNDELFKEYLVLRKNSLSKTYIYANEKNYNKYLKNRIGNMNSKDVTTAKVQQIINEILDSGKAPQTAKAIKEIVVEFYKFLPEIGIQNIENICRSIKIPKFDNTRNIELTDEQTKNLFKALFTYEDIKIRTIVIWLLQGRRKSEVLNMQWDNIWRGNLV